MPLYSASQPGAATALTAPPAVSPDLMLALYQSKMLGIPLQQAMAMQGKAAPGTGGATPVAPGAPPTMPQGGGMGPTGAPPTMPSATTPGAAPMNAPAPAFGMAQNPMARPAGGGINPMAARMGGQMLGGQRQAQPINTLPSTLQTIQGAPGANAAGIPGAPQAPGQPGAGQMTPQMLAYLRAMMMGGQPGAGAMAPPTGGAGAPFAPPQ